MPGRRYELQNKESANGQQREVRCSNAWCYPGLTLFSGVTSRFSSAKTGRIATDYSLELGAIDYRWNWKMWWPAEYDAHEGCILLFPHASEQTTYQTATLLRNAQAAVMDVIAAIVQHGKEHVFLFCHDETHRELVISMLKERTLPFVIASSDTSTSSLATKPMGEEEYKVFLFLCPSNDTWARDTGPTFCFRPSSTARSDLVGLDWDFNAYGGEADGCYFPYSLDQRIASTMIEQINRYYSASSASKILHEPIPSLVLEGGSIHTDGEGTILTTKECLLHPNRNPDQSPDEIERIILQATGCAKLIWLDAGLAHDDDTNGHIDNWACFAKPGHIVLAWTDDAEHDPVNVRNCRAARTTLEQATDAQGRSLVVHKLHLPSPLYFSSDEDLHGTTEAEITTTVTRVQGTRMAASYVNFYIANRAVLVPQFQDPVYDEKAIKVLQGLFPDRVVVGIPNSRDILYGGGNVHCITQQVPKFTGI
jgi:agmatine deiminase